MNDNILHHLKFAAKKAEAKPAFILPGDGSITYGAFYERVSRLASLLSDMGLSSGDRLVAQIDKSLANVALYLATLQVGAIYVPLNTAYTSTELEYFLGDAKPVIFVGRSETLSVIEPIAQRLGVAHSALLDGDDGLWEQALLHRPMPEVAHRRGDDIASIIYTSGTTGRSKGAMLSHENLLHNAKALHKLWGFEPGDTLLHALPIYHVHGLMVALHTSLLNATPIILLDRFEAETVRQHLPNSTVLMGVPTFYSRLSALPGFGAEDCRSIRLFTSGSAPLTSQASDAWTELTGHRILERYGMSEAGMITSNPYQGDRLAGTVGYPLPEVELRVADEAGQELPKGEIGVIEIKGPNIFRGYWKMEDKTADAFRDDGFFITGDNALQDEDGRVTIVGRAKDLIISGGLNIYPKEIEQVLDDVPGVLETAIIGTPHADLGEGVVAICVATGEALSDETLQSALQDTIARFKHPRKFYWVESLPRNAMGKVQKAVLRETFKDAYA
ncbi:MAG: AMP-binding protein [Pseudomonadota bacterium]|nr:AMP-binding protein [Pseudomonadota bacterium]